MKWLLAIRGIWSFNQALLAVIAPLYLIEIGMSTTRVGLLLSVIAFGSAAMVLTVGLLSDMIGRKPLLLAITALYIVGVVNYALTTHFWVLAVTGAIATIGRGGAVAGGNFGPFYPAEQAITAASVPDHRRTHAFSMISLAGLLVGALGALTASTDHLLQNTLDITALASFRALLIAAASLGGVMLLLVLPLRDTRLPKTETGGPFTIQKDTVRLLSKLWMTNSLNGFARGMLGPFLTYWFAVYYGAGSGQIGVLYTVISLAAAAPYLAASRIVGLFGSVQTIFVVRFTAAVLLVAMAFSPSFILAAIAYVGFGILNLLAIPIRQSLIMGITDEKDRSKVAAMGNLPSQITVAISPSIGARLLQTAFQQSPFWLAGGVLMLNAVLFRIVFRNTRPPEEVEQEPGGAQPGR